MASQELRLEPGDLTDLGPVRDLYGLLKAIDLAMPKEATLYVEGTSIAPEVRDYLGRRQGPAPRRVEPGTLWPKPQVFHLPLEGRKLEELRDLAERHAEPEICDHLVVYLDDRVLLWAHDAGSGHVELARSLPVQLANGFREALRQALRER